MTERLYDADSYASVFEATVLSCKKDRENRYAAVLDRTLFFPEQGGQYADKGTLNGQAVLDVQIVGGEIVHYIEKPFSEGELVRGAIDFAERFRRMQNHTGEHVLSGLVFRRYGYRNVGFHLGDEVTVDYDREFSPEQADEIERAANEVVYKNLPVLARYLTPEEKETLVYRSKKEIEGPVRVVSIPDCDDCACCAPHVRSTGEIGVIKIVSRIRYKGGTRLTVLCGSDALADYQKKSRLLAETAQLFSTKQERLPEAVSQLFLENAELKKERVRLHKALLDRILEGWKVQKGAVDVFLVDAVLGEDALRQLGTGWLERTNRTTLLVLEKEEGECSFALLGTADVRPLTARLCEALGGKGGGKPEMTRGRIPASFEKIQKTVRQLL